MQRHAALLRLLAWSLLLTGPTWRASAQSSDEITTGMQLNFLPPGARSLAMGGAFLGAADDATAAFANPAGLTQLVEPEASLEGRHWTQRTRYVDRGHRGQPIGLGIDTIEGFVFEEQVRRVEGLSFASVVYPRGRLSLALYHHQLARYRAGIRAQGAFYDDSVFGLVRYNPSISELALDIAATGGAVGWRVSDQLSLGLSAAFHEFELASRSQIYGVRFVPNLPDNVFAGRVFGPPVYRPNFLVLEQTQTGEDEAVGWSVGFLWRPDARWSVGGVYRPGPSFDFEATSTRGPLFPVEENEAFAQLGTRGRFHVPDTAGVGVTYRPTESTLLSFDWHRVEYSDLARDLVNLQTILVIDGGRFVASDANELHLGFEYQNVTARWPWSLRLGAWYDPEHRIRYEGERSEFLENKFLPGEDELHYAAGFGVVVGRVQIDVAADVSDPVDTISLSGVVRF
jgi:long-chain fatty acid transport protein